MLFPGSAFKLQIKFFGAPAQFLQHREKVFCFKKILEEILREDVSLRSKNIQKESLELFYKSQEKSQSKQILCLAHFLQHLKIQKGSNISQPQSNKTPRKKLSVATQGRCLSESNQFQKESLHCSQKSQENSATLRKINRISQTPGNFFGSAHFLQHFQNSKREVTDLKQHAKRKKLSVSRKSSETS